MTHRPAGRLVAAGALLLTLALLAPACSQGGGRSAGPTTTRNEAAGGPTTSSMPGGPESGGIRIEVLSSQPDRVSGDDARIRVTPGRGSRPEQLRVKIGDHDVTPQLTQRRGALVGVLNGFVEGTNTLVATTPATAKTGQARAALRVRAWPLEGPMISGPHLPLLACSTRAAGLFPPTDADCSAPAHVTWRYLDDAHQLHDLPSPTTGAPPTDPADLGHADIGGRRMPLYVRFEQGVINRSIYEIATIDPTPSEGPAGGTGTSSGPTRSLDDAAWNGVLLYRTGDGCGTTYGQGTSATTALEPSALVKGYAVATATANTSAVQCNDVLAAETTMMVKERVIEELGRPRFTIGEGAGQGAAQLHLMVQNYPGLVDGVVAELPYPDTFTVASGASDCGLLLDAFGQPVLAGLTDVQRQAVTGFATLDTCRAWNDQFGGNLRPADGCDPAIPQDAIYDPVRRRSGLRCTLHDGNRNQLGTDPKTGFAARPLDNVGVQYGLEALNAKLITPTQFLDLNAEVGGYDVDGQITADRERARTDTVARAYETGRVANGGGDLLDVPMIEVAVFADARGDVHDRFRAFSLRDRLTRGASPELVPGLQIWTRDAAAVDPLPAVGSGSGGSGYGAQAVDAVELWLSALAADHEPGPRRDALGRTRPASAVDNCVPPGAGAPVSGVGIYDKPGPCRDAFPVAGDPRIAAGAPRSDDVLKCGLKPADPTDYQVRFSDEEAARLDKVFPDGVCDYSEAGIGSTVPVNPDRSYDEVETPQQRA